MRLDEYLTTTTYKGVNVAAETYAGSRIDERAASLRQGTAVPAEQNPLSVLEQSFEEALLDQAEALHRALGYLDAQLDRLIPLAK